MSNYIHPDLVINDSNDSSDNVLDELDRILDNFADEVLDRRIAYEDSKRLPKTAIRMLVSKHYISKEDVLAAIGEDEPFDFKSGNAIPMMVEEAWKNGRNELRAEIHKKLGLGG